jgi:hypothetical protein
LKGAITYRAFLHLIKDHVPNGYIGILKAFNVIFLNPILDNLLIVGLIISFLFKYGDPLCCISIPFLLSDYVYVDRIFLNIVF